MFSCSGCAQTYESKDSLRRHAKKKHPLYLNSILVPPEKKFKCNECEKQYNNKDRLSIHEKNVHNIRYVNLHRLFSCALCDFEHYEKNNILAHLSKAHNLNVVPEVKQFQNKQDFLEWKMEEEKNRNCKYVAAGGSHKDRQIRSQIFVCNRSQYYIPKGNSERTLKLQGSCKINAYCPAEIKYSEENGIYSVRFIRSHTHKMELEHIRLTLEEKSEIAQKIAAGISFNNILDQVRESLYKGDELKRIHLLTRKDLLNIEQCFNLRKHQRHKNDAVSIEAWIREETENNSTSSAILFYKPQGQLCPDSPELLNSDFVLIIMNSAQGELLKKFGQDTLCIDGTHGLNQYDFQLITLMVIDDFHQGFPCAFLISNRCVAIISRLFFLKIKERVGDICSDTFMSDMDEAFFNGYKLVFPLPKRRLFCSWHVDRAWRKNLSKIGSKETQSEIYKILRTLLEESDENSFYALFAEAKSLLLNNNSTKDFGNYFIDNYEHNVKSWAFCFRLHCGINTNMHLERMHRTIKEIYCNKKKVKRLDSMLYILQRFVRDRLFDQLIVHHKGKITSKIKDLRKRHKASLELNPAIIVDTENGWLCQSTSSSDVYFISFNDSFKNCDCHLKCLECNKCIHKFTCTCIDNSVQWNMCKHIHLLCRIKFNEAVTTDGNLSSISLENNTEERAILTEITKKRKVHNEEIELQKEKNEILNIVKKVVDEANKEQIQVIKQHVKP